MGFGRSEVSWLRAPRRAFPESRRLPSGYMRRISARSQWRDRAGFTPDFPRPPAVERRAAYPTASTPRRRRVQTPSGPLESLAAPPSSRGLGRRPLTAETGVRIPVAVLPEPVTRAADDPITSWRDYALAPWFWLALTYLLVAVGAFVLYGGADYPGLFADSPGGLEGGPERDVAIEKWEDRYFDVGLPFAIAAAISTLGWLVAFGQRWLLVTAVAAGAVLALVPLIKVGVFLLPIFVVPVFLLLFLPWQAAAAVFVGVAVAALAFRPSRERLALHLVALYVAFCAQAIFTTLSASIARGTFS
jgi:hypothetical protein